jgi:hypothetical protein
MIITDDSANMTAICPLLSAQNRDPNSRKRAKRKYSFDRPTFDAAGLFEPTKRVEAIC